MNYTHILEFLIDLKFNNNKEWFHANSERYDNARVSFISLVDGLITQISLFDKTVSGLSAKDCLFRINRDIRFSKNKEPYKTNFGAYIAPGGRKSLHAGYYLHCEADSSFLGGGIYMPEPDVLKAIRSHISENLSAWKGILDNKSFKRYYTQLSGEQLKTTPKGFSADDPALQWIRYKSFAMTHSIQNEVWEAGDTMKQLMRGFEILHPFNEFLNHAEL